MAGDLSLSPIEAGAIVSDPKRQFFSIFSQIHVDAGCLSMSHCVGNGFLSDAIEMRCGGVVRSMRAGVVAELTIDCEGRGNFSAEPLQRHRQSAGLQVDGIEAMRKL